jgi:hypothetical protein
MANLNADWHRKHPMPARASLDQRLQWHRRHAKACACREIPAPIVAEMKRRGIRIPERDIRRGRM